MNQGGSGVDLAAAGAEVLARIFGMQPLLLVVLAIAAVVAQRHRRLGSFVPTALFGAVIIFQAAAQITGTTFGRFRFYIFVISLVVITVLTWWSPVTEHARGASGWARHLPGCGHARRRGDVHSPHLDIDVEPGSGESECAVRLPVGRVAFDASDGPGVLLSTVPGRPGDRRVAGSAESAGGIGPFG
ncbi:hypothetical protein [Rhodococcus sp. H29-C3]|uniref:hypothetical protein n=1 Tax=Rhodococcus sp. H29-C3 TaxID=3046307 RepID=UPI0024BA3E0B|nr:hypothetical protein [Rhodococcus sp. H29-C3]MDJ0362562.1 hypothetical protein [Rhodococcus sp. H29-C3]